MRPSPKKWGKRKNEPPRGKARGFLEHDPQVLAPQAVVDLSSREGGIARSGIGIQQAADYSAACFFYIKRKDYFGRSK
jgi:hypothetical protein